MVEFALILPILLILFLAVADLARIYTTMVTIESAAREAADHGAWDEAFWAGAQPGTDPVACDPATNCEKTLAQMTERSCLASRDLPDYVGPDNACTNPSMTVELQEPDGSPGLGCDDPGDTRVTQCRVVVTLEHDFNLIVPASISLFNVTVGFPSTLTFERTAIYAISDFELAGP